MPAQLSFIGLAYFFHTMAFRMDIVDLNDG